MQLSKYRPTTIFLELLCYIIELWPLFVSKINCYPTSNDQKGGGIKNSSKVFYEFDNNFQSAWHEICLCKLKNVQASLSASRIHASPALRYCPANVPQSSAVPRWIPLHEINSATSNHTASEVTQSGVGFLNVKKILVLKISRQICNCWKNHFCHLECEPDFLQTRRRTHTKNQ